MNYNNYNQRNYDELTYNLFLEIKSSYLILKCNTKISLHLTDVHFRSHW